MNDSIISFYWNNSTDYLLLNSQEIELKVGSKVSNILFSNLISIRLNTKKKLAPLIIGAVATSLALVNILIEGAGLSMMGLLSIGLLVLYFGTSDYWVFSIELYSKSYAVWVSKNKCPQIPFTLINIIDFKVSKGFFPPFYAFIKKEDINDVITNSDTVDKVIEPIKYYLIPPKNNPELVMLKIDITKISNQIVFVLDQVHLAEGKHQINKAALMDIEA